MLPIRLESTLNAREHWSVRHKRAKAHRMNAGFAVRSGAAVLGAVSFPLIVTIVRIAPRRLDQDNLAASCKHVQDGVADALGVDDGDERITWRYAQRKGKPREYACEIVIEAVQP